jgi:hypothetical protein
VPKNHPDILLAKADMFACLNLIPAKFISSNINALIKTCVDDIFGATSSSPDFTASLSGFFESDDLNIASELTEATTAVRFKLFTSTCVRKAIEVG